MTEILSLVLYIVNILAFVWYSNTGLDMIYNQVVRDMFRAIFAFVFLGMAILLALKIVFGQ